MFSFSSWKCALNNKKIIFKNFREKKDYDKVVIFTNFSSSSSSNNKSQIRENKNQFHVVSLVFSCVAIFRYGRSSLLIIWFEMIMMMMMMNSISTTTSENSTWSIIIDYTILAIFTWTQFIMKIFRNNSIFMIQYDAFKHLINISN